MSKSISQRIEDSFGEDNSKEIEKFLDWTLARIQDYAQSLRRSFALIISLIAAFELVNQAHGESITVGSLRIDKGSVALQLIPPVVAFLYLQSIIDSRLSMRQIKAFRALLNKWMPKAAADRDLSILPLRIPMPIYWYITLAPPEDIHDRKANIVEPIASLVTAMVLLMGVIAFEAHAYYSLFHADLHQDILWFISLIVTMFCLIMSALEFL